MKRQDPRHATTSPSKSKKAVFSKRAVFRGAFAFMLLVGAMIDGTIGNAGADGGCGEYSFGFTDTRLINDGISNSAGPFPIDLPAGLYDVTMVGKDNHTTTPYSDQPGERWYVDLNNGWQSPLTDDLPDDMDMMTTALAAQTISASTAISVHHAGEGNVNSIEVVCVGFTTVVSEADEGEPDTEDETSEDETSEDEISEDAGAEAPAENDMGEDSADDAVEDEVSDTVEDEVSDDEVAAGGDAEASTEGDEPVADQEIRAEEEMPAEEDLTDGEADDEGSGEDAPEPIEEEMPATEEASGDEGAAAEEGAVAEEGAESETPTEEVVEVEATADPAAEPLAGQVEDEAPPAEPVTVESEDAPEADGEDGPDLRALLRRLLALRNL